MSRRALTLVETLAGLVLLSILAAGAAPLIRQSTQLLAAPTPDPGNFFALSQLADAALTSPTAFGLPADITSARRVDDAVLETTITPADSPADPVTLRELRPPGDAPDHAWLIFERRGIALSRWVPLQPPREPEP